MLGIDNFECDNESKLVEGPGGKLCVESANLAVRKTCVKQRPNLQDGGGSPVNINDGGVNAQRDALEVR